MSMVNYCQIQLLELSSCHSTQNWVWQIIKQAEWPVFWEVASKAKNTRKFCYSSWAAKHFYCIADGDSGVISLRHNVFTKLDD